MLHGRIDQLAMMRTIWNANTRAEVRRSPLCQRAAQTIGDPHSGALVGGGYENGEAVAFGETGEELDQRARRALDQAVARRADHVIPACEIERIMLSPAPAS